MFGSHLVEGSFVEALDQNEMLGCLDTANFQRTVAKIHRGWHTYLKKSSLFADLDGPMIGKFTPNLI